MCKEGLFDRRNNKNIKMFGCSILFLRFDKKCFGFHSVKEADHIRTKSQKVNLFQSSDFKRIWNAIIENDLSEWKQAGMKP